MPELGFHIMGGTIDSRNDPNLDGEAVPLRKSLVRKYIESLRLNLEMQISEICLKDSRGITEDDQENLLRSLNEIDAQHNVVTIGTYRMRDVARFLFSKDAGKNRSIVFTGAMSPLLGSVDEEGQLSPSDAGFNLGYAISQSLHFENGVYQVMNGETFQQPHEEWWHDQDGVHWNKPQYARST